MNIEDVKTIEELAEFMEAEAALWGRADSEQKFVNGAGIRQQWHERINFPMAIFYMISQSDETSPTGTAFNMKSMYFDEEGNKTARPKRNTDTLYHND